MILNKSFMYQKHLTESNLGGSNTSFMIDHLIYTFKKCSIKDL